MKYLSIKKYLSSQILTLEPVRTPYGLAREANQKILDAIETKWLRDAGVIPAKDQMSVKEFLQVENNPRRSSTRFVSRHKTLRRQFFK